MDFVVCTYNFSNLLPTMVNSCLVNTLMGALWAGTTSLAETTKRCMGIIPTIMDSPYYSGTSILRYGKGTAKSYC